MRNDLEYLQVDKLFRSKKTVTLGRDVREELSKEQDHDVLDRDQIHYQEAWSFLAGKVVGAEGAEDG